MLRIAWPAIALAVLVQCMPEAEPELARPLAHATRPAVREIVQAVEARYRHAATLKAEFYERYNDGKGAGQAESGTVYFARPGRMRWEYESPQQKLFLVDGKNVWFYVPADHAASRAKMKESSDWRTPIALLAGKADLGKVCRNIQLLKAPNISAANPEAGASSGGTTPESNSGAEATLSPHDSLLSCTPRESTDEFGQPIRDILVETDPEAHVVRVVVRQPGNVETEFRFGNWQENISISESKFHFEAPPGVAIVDEQTLAGQIY
jgi:outer membrane lipoprotein carrier protein